MGRKNGIVVPVFVDVEADGPSPVTHSMVQLGAIDPNGNSFKANFRPRPNQKHNVQALTAIGMTREQTLGFPEDAIGIRDFHNWLTVTYTAKRLRPVFWSDNPAFDWQWVNGYFTLYDLKNPFGYSARRIGDFYAGCNRDLSQSVQWKRWRATAHSHDALDDATGNMEAFMRMKKEYTIR